jgi:hypothetical protein
MSTPEGQCFQEVTTFVASHRTVPPVTPMIAFTALPVAAMGAGTLRLQGRRQLLLHDDLLQTFEDRFALGEGEAQRGGGQVLPLHTGDVPCLGLALVGGDHDLNGILYGNVPSD